MSVNKRVDQEEEALYAELYKELEETDRRISRTRKSRTTKRGAMATATSASTIRGASSEPLTYTRRGSSSTSGVGMDHEHEALLQHLEEIDAAEEDEEVGEPEYDSDGNLLNEGDFIFNSETDEDEWSDANLASDHPFDEELP